MRAPSPITTAQGNSRWAVGVAFLLVAGLPAFSSDAQWLQWGGPQHDFTCETTGLAEQWPADGPRKVWASDIGPGHSAIVTDGELLFTMCRRVDKDAVVAYRAANGEKVWETQYDAPCKPDMLLEFGCGPHSTPLLVADRLFTVGGLVHLRCLDKRTGRVLWGHDLMDEMGASHMQRGYGASPVAYQDLVILNIGGTDVGVAAFRQDTGEIAWKSEKFRGGYPTPLIVKINAQDHLIDALGPDRVGLDPATGQTRWRATVDVQLAGIMSSPVFIPPDRVLFSCAYGGGTQLFQIKYKDGAYTAEEVWFQPKMKVMHGTLIRSGDYVYGSSGDFGPAFLMGLDLATGKIAWRDRGFAKATLLGAAGKLIILDEEGNLALATPTPDGLTVHSRAKVLEPLSWTVPTLVGTRLYLRDNRTIMALDLSRTAAEEVQR
jgi:outer membrane protein assembly factor BamB